MSIPTPHTSPHDNWGGGDTEHSQYLKPVHTSRHSPYQGLLTTLEIALISQQKLFSPFLRTKHTPVIQPVLDTDAFLSKTSLSKHCPTFSTCCSQGNNFYQSKNIQVYPFRPPFALVIQLKTNSRKDRINFQQTTFLLQPTRWPHSHWCWHKAGRHR